MKVFYALLAGALSVTLSLSATAADRSFDVVVLPGVVAALFDDQERTVARTRSGVFFHLTLDEDGRFRANGLAYYAPPKASWRADMLPDGLLALGSGAIKEAYLVGPTSRYRHGVMGNAIEAAGLRVITRGGGTLEFRLPPGSVFEGLMPSLEDVDGDGNNEVVVVCSYLDAEAAVAVLGVRDGALVLIAETEPIGRSNRWLNPVGVADFDADGRPEVAVVKTPHIVGILELYELVDDAVRTDLSTRGYSSHFIGSRDLFPSRVIDVDRDGVLDIVVPSADRGALRFIGVAKDKINDLGTEQLPVRAQTNMLPIDPKTCSFAFGLANGALAVVLRVGDQTLISHRLAPKIFG
jgi:hypothetical protein